MGTTNVDKKAAERRNFFPLRAAAAAAAVAGARHAPGRVAIVSGSSRSAGRFLKLPVLINRIAREVLTRGESAFVLLDEDAVVVAETRTLRRNGEPPPPPRCIVSVQEHF